MWVNWDCLGVPPDWVGKHYFRGRMGLPKVPEGFLPEGSEGLEVDRFQHVLRGIQLQKQHDEDTVIRQLLELSVANVMILDEDADHDAQDLRVHETAQC